jgi:hypothetical protein
MAITLTLLLTSYPIPYVRLVGELQLNTGRRISNDEIDIFVAKKSRAQPKVSTGFGEHGAAGVSRLLLTIP